VLLLPPHHCLQALPTSAAWVQALLLLLLPQLVQQQ
jgi:hypothetical protein